MSKTIIVSNRLPVRIEREGEELNYFPSEGGLATGLGSIYKEGNNIWVGWPGASFRKSEEKERVKKDLAKENMSPVFLSDRDVEEFYLGFSNQTLWPAFHYFLQYIDYDHENWNTYVEVNKKFAKAISEHVEEGDVLWIHDYQLLLVPGLMRKKFPDLTIGFFLHIPFPSYEVFRTLPWRKDLLDGVLGSDYVAFHTYDDMRHFLSSVHRLAGYPYRGKEIELEDRVVIADSLPMGIDYDKYAENATHQDSGSRAKRYRGWLGSTRLILSMDRLDYSKGIPNRLRAYEKFLDDYPDYREKVALLLIVVPSRDKVPNYQKLKEDVDELVGKINSKYGRLNWTPIHYYYRSFPFHALGAFYSICDVAMVTPRRDGMNLIAKEYVASRTNGDGVLILSEMAGASKELSDAILVNPNDRTQMVEALKTALEMPAELQRKNMATMQATLRKYDIYSWVKLFFENLKQAKAAQEDKTTARLTNGARRTLLEDYEKAENRLIFLDYDGTLIEFDKDPEAVKPDRELKKIIAKLQASDKNKVVIISGRKYQTLEEWTRGCPVSLVAEHGVWEREGESSWTGNLEETSPEAMDAAREIMEFYVDRTPGSFIEEKSHSLAWHYRRVEKGLGAVRTGELTSHLRHVLDNQFVVLEGDHVVEVKPEIINKGNAVTRWYEKVQPDFMLCIGDDTTDEDMFEALPDEAYTIKVGRGNSYARYHLKSVSETRKLLDRLADIG